jgi:hypothetical protein
MASVQARLRLEKGRRTGEAGRQSLVRQIGVRYAGQRRSRSSFLLLTPRLLGPFLAFYIVGSLRKHVPDLAFRVHESSKGEGRSEGPVESETDANHLA